VDALDIVRVLRRRWKITVAVAAVLVVLVGAVLFLVPEQYKVTAIGLVTPASSTDVRNPYTAADQSQSQMAALLVTVLTSSVAAAGYTAAGANGTIDVTNANGVTDTSQTNSPFITIVATDISASAAVHDAQVVRQRAVDELKNRQDAAKVGPAQRLTLTDVLPAADATTTSASQLRAAGLVAALGLVLGVLGVVVADRVLTRRKPAAPAVPPPLVIERVNGSSEHRQGVLSDIRPTAPKDESPTIKFSPIRSEEKQGGGSHR
jgi:capsular polysaccharide biosynthesis protein